MMDMGRVAVLERGNGAEDTGSDGGTEGGLEMVQKDEIKEMLETLREKTAKLKEYL